jgi:hypothetical protein
MTPETNQAVIELVRLIGAGVVGGLIATYATHRLTRTRERESGRDKRKREFRSFIVQFRSEAADRHHPSTRDFALFYRDKVPNLRHAAAFIADDFPRKRRAQFDGLVSAAAGFTGAEGKQRVIASLDDILRFLDA